jgi:hypothetical protein
MAGRDVEILLKARDDASAKIAALEAKLLKLQQTAGRPLPGERDTFRLGQAVAYATKVDVALQSVQAISAAIGGEHQKALDAIYQMPLGLGAVARTMADIYVEITGINKELDQYREHQEEWSEGNKRLAERRDMLIKLRDISAEAQKRRATADQPDKWQRQVNVLMFEAQKQLEEIDRIVMEREASSLTVDVDMRKRAMEAAAEVTATLDNELAQLRRRHEEEAAKKSQEESDKQFKREMELAELRSELRERGIRNNRDDLYREEKAQIESIRRRYATQIAEAKRAGDATKADLLAQLRDKELTPLFESLERPRKGDRTGDRTGAFESRTSTYATGFSIEQNSLAVARQQLQQLQMMVRGVGNLGQTMERVLARLPQFV